MLAYMATRGSQFSQPSGMGENIFRDMWNDNNQGMTNPFIGDHDELLMDVYGFQGLLAMTMS